MGCHRPRTRHVQGVKTNPVRHLSGDHIVNPGRDDKFVRIAQFAGKGGGFRVHLKVSGYIARTILSE